MVREKMMKTARILDRVMLIMQWVCGSVGVLVVAAYACTFLFRDALVDASGTVFTVITVGGMSLSLGPETMREGNGLITWMPLVLAGIAAAATGAILFGFFLFRKIVKPMKSGEPFATSVSTHVRQLAFYFLGVGIMGQIIATALSATVTRFVNAFQDSVALQLTQTYTVHFPIDLSFLLVALVLFLLAYVFRYGEELQRESDETL